MRNAQALWNRSILSHIAPKQTLESNPETHQRSEHQEREAASEDSLDSADKSVWLDLPAHWHRDYNAHLRLRGKTSGFALDDPQYRVFPSSMALPTLLDLDESGWMSLLFISSDPATELLQRPTRNLDTINCIRMDLDIVLEILRYLHPLELLQISRTSKAFHELLRFPITDLTWRNSFMVEDHPKTRASDPKLPPCPSQISGRRWAKLLFSPKICEECCQCKSSADVDYALLRRVCDTCLDANAERRLSAEGFDKRDLWTLWRVICACEALCRKPRLTTSVDSCSPAHRPPRRGNANQAPRIELRKNAAFLALRAPVPGSRNTYYLPPHTIYAFPLIAQLVNEDPAEPLALDDPRLVAAVATAPAFLDAWALDIQRSLIVLLPSPGPPGSWHNLQPGIHLLQRATSVFKVQLPYIYNYRRYMFIGWDGSMAAAAALAVLLGLDPETVTAAEMDEANARFLCGTCPPESKGQRRARGWRHCIFHASNTADVRRREQPDDYSDLCVWSCTLCTLFIPSFETQSSVRDHLRVKHQIADPAGGHHFIRFLGPQIPRRRRVMFHVDAVHPARYRCRRCPPHVVKLFRLRALRLHVRDKHLVEFSDDDYDEFDLLSTPDLAMPSFLLTNVVPSMGHSYVLPPPSSYQLFSIDANAGKLIHITPDEASRGCSRDKLTRILTVSLKTKTISSLSTILIMVPPNSTFFSHFRTRFVGDCGSCVGGAEDDFWGADDLCLFERSDLSVTLANCKSAPETIAWAVTAGSSASSAPPLGSITHQYVPTATSPRNGTFCLGVNGTSAGVADGTSVLLKPCVTTDAAQKWAVREGDGTIRLGTKCLHPVFNGVSYRKIDQKWAAIPKPPSRGIAGYESGSADIVMYRLDSTSQLCFTAPVVLGGALTLSACTFSSETSELASQNFTLAAGSFSTVKGAVGAITLPLAGATSCLDVVTQTTNGTSVDYLGIQSCLTGCQVNNDSTTTLAGSNKCVAGALVAKSKLLVVDCIAGNANQTWSITQVPRALLF
ncbi:hypothetical protein C8J57DRAFT_1527848 [Mycena rebaudengoi]|nr:hypothetical protein C8J57DRAFT_1527848 [Mycena rebaudengoi]